VHASTVDEPRFELPEAAPEIALIRRRSDADVTPPDSEVLPVSPSETADVPLRSAPVREGFAGKRRASAHVGLATFAGVLVGSASVALFLAVAGRDDAHLAPAAAGEEPAGIAPSVMDLEPAPEPLASAGAAAAPIDPGEAHSGSNESASAPSPLDSVTAVPIASPSVTPKTAITKPCDLALMYAQRGEMAQAIRRFDSCLSPEREWVRQQIGQRSAVEVRAKAEKGQCDEAGAIVAQVESIGAAAAAKVAFASRCDSREHELGN
jgi:hypothetical protein